MSYAEKRVTTDEFGSLPGASALLVPLGAIGPGLKIHRAILADVEALGVAMAKDLGGPFRIASGWRPHRWVKFSDYVAELLQRYSARVNATMQQKKGRPATRDEVIAYGRGVLGFNSPHETGLAIDLGCFGLAPVTATQAAQLKSAGFQWVRAHAWEHGFTPYIGKGRTADNPIEPWHLEHWIAQEPYRTGAAAADVNAGALEDAGPDAPKESEADCGPCEAEDAIALPADDPGFLS